MMMIETRGPDIFTPPQIPAKDLGVREARAG